MRSGAWTMPGSRSPTGTRLARADLAARGRRARRRCRRSSSTCPTASATARAARRRRCTTPTSPATATPRCASTCAAAATPTACCPTSTPQQEQDDALEVIAWLAAQPWCSGAVGMIGISWGGFNGLQVAARRPPALKAIITAVLDRRPLRRRRPLHGRLRARRRHAAVGGHDARARRALPPDPARGRRALARDVAASAWSARPPFLEAWLRHQRRDDYWQHGSVCEDYAAIECARLRDRRLGRRLHQRDPPPARRTCRRPRQGLIGPWAHAYPARRRARPARSASCRSALRWWDHWLKGARHRRSWTSRCCAPGCRTAWRPPATTPSGPAAGSPSARGPPPRSRPTRCPLAAEPIGRAPAPLPQPRRRPPASTPAPGARTAALGGLAGRPARRGRPLAGLRPGAAGRAARDPRRRRWSSSSSRPTGRARSSRCGCATSRPTARRCWSPAGC